IEGFAPGLQYLIRDGRYDRSQSKWLDSFRTTLVLAPAGGKPNAGIHRIVLANELALRVVNASHQSIRIKDIRQIQVQQADKAWWSMGPKPSIVGHKGDGWVLVDRKHFALAKPGAAVEITFQAE